MKAERYHTSQAAVVIEYKPITDTKSDTSHNGQKRPRPCVGIIETTPLQRTEILTEIATRRKRCSKGVRWP